MLLLLLLFHSPLSIISLNFVSSVSNGSTVARQHMRYDLNLSDPLTQRHQQLKGTLACLCMSVLMNYSSQWCSSGVPGQCGNQIAGR